MSFAKKILNPFSSINNPARLLSGKLDPIGNEIARRGFNSKPTGFGGRTGDWFTSKRADLTGNALLASRGVNPDGSSMSTPRRVYQRRSNSYVDTLG